MSAGVSLRTYLEHEEGDRKRSRQPPARRIRSLREALAHIRADYVINTGEWDSPALDWPIDRDGVRAAAATDAFVEGMAVLARGDRDAVSRAIAENDPFVPDFRY